MLAEFSGSCDSHSQPGSVRHGQIDGSQKMFQILFQNSDFINEEWHDYFPPVSRLMS